MMMFFKYSKSNFSHEADMAKIIPGFKMDLKGSMTGGERKRRPLCYPHLTQKLIALHCSGNLFAIL